MSDHDHNHRTFLSVEDGDFLKLCLLNQFLEVELFLWSPLDGSDSSLSLLHDLNLLSLLLSEFLLENVSQVLFVDERFEAEQIVY